MKHHVLHCGTVWFGTLLWLTALMAPAAAMSQDNPLGLKAHHITASVLDIDRATKWYQDMLGFKIVKQGSYQSGAMRFAELEIPGFGVGLIQLPGASGKTTTTASAQPSWVHIVFSVPDPNAAYQHLKQRHADVFTRAEPGPGPVTTFLIHDSEGNEIEIVAATPG